MREDSNLPPAADEYGRTVSPYFNLEDKKEKYEADKLFKKLRRKTGSAIADYGMIKEGDKVLVCISGGKDSYAMLDLLLSLKRSSPFDFTLVPVHLDSGFPGSPEHKVREHLDKVGLDYLWLKKDVYALSHEHINDPRKTLCSICSRLRRGYLYACARAIGAEKVALGHHRDDLLATYFLNLFYGGIMKTMPPMLRTDDGRLSVIRPLCYCKESELIRLCRLKDYPVLPKGLCGAGENEQRSAIMQMLRQWESENPKRLEIIFKALKNIVPSHLLDSRLYDFEGARLKGDPYFVHSATYRAGKLSGSDPADLVKDAWCRPRLQITSLTKEE